jgi:DNA-directed RNA polymerase subunit E'
MYSLVTVRDTVRIPPKLFSESLEDSVLAALREQYEGKLDNDLGVIITITHPREIGDGKIIPGDGAAYHDAVFDVLTFRPELHEVVRGKVSEITEFGAFVRFGPIDGLVHVSQVTDDFVSFNDKTGLLSGRDTKRSLKKGDIVNARIIAVSMKNTVTDSKINLTMRQPGLGKEDWKNLVAKPEAPRREHRRKKK